MCFVCMQIWTLPPQSLGWPRSTTSSLSLPSRHRSGGVHVQTPHAAAPVSAPVLTQVAARGFAYLELTSPSARGQPHQADNDDECGLDW